MKLSKKTPFHAAIEVASRTYEMRFTPEGNAVVIFYERFKGDHLAFRTKEDEDATALGEMLYETGNAHVYPVLEITGTKHTEAIVGGSGVREYVLIDKWERRQ